MAAQRELEVTTWDLNRNRLVCWGLPSVKDMRTFPDLIGRYDEHEYGRNPALVYYGNDEVRRLLSACGVPEEAFEAYRQGGSDYQHFLDNQRALVIGVGTGREVIALRSFGAGIYGIDKNGGAVEITKKKLAALGISDRVVLEQRKAETLIDSPDLLGQFNVVSSLFCVLNFVEPDQFENLINRVPEWLKPHGVFVAALYGPVTAPIFQNQDSLPYEPAIAAKRRTGGVEVVSWGLLKAHFTDIDTVKASFEEKGFGVNIHGFLRIAALFPRIPEAKNIQAFLDIVKQVDQSAYSVLGKIDNPRLMLKTAYDYDRLYSEQNPKCRNFAYLLLTARRI